ncbi:FecCD family ABC transporter permease [Cumulibacter soli]|uniref:FecCD family ABC transporter permease n=1 Tax=Cumulibacter soli TaxID=2546344 RepID=UPI0010689473|nr:iron chelate uptake ABC transporter family permease subunit [Cumulibacter soli]
MKKSTPARSGEVVIRAGRRVAMPVRTRSLVVGGVFVVMLLVVAVLTLSLGRLGIPLPELPSAVLTGADGKAGFVLEVLRGPRLVVAAGTGAALGISGALFQSVTRNPLGSPDVIGIAAGAGAGAALFGLLMPGALPVWTGALIGATAAIVLVAAATGSGFANPGRMILAGIGVSAMAVAFTQYVTFVVARDRASVLQSYINGSLNARSWTHALTIWIVLAVCVVPLIVISQRLAATEMGDEVAQSLGVHPRSTRRWAVAISVLLAAAAVTVAGPIAFVALTAPHIARRLAHSAVPQLTLSALAGALLLCTADVVAEQVSWFEGLPVGILTLGIGGAYLGFLLVREWKKGTA